MIYAGKPLEGYKTLKDYYIQRDSTLFLLADLRGGGDGSCKIRIRNFLTHEIMNKFDL